MTPKRTAYDPKDPEQTVSLTINADLYAQAKGLGVNASQIAEDALARELARLHAERLGAEIRADLEVANAYASAHGSFAEMVRDHHGSDPTTHPVPRRDRRSARLPLSRRLNDRRGAGDRVVARAAVMPRRPCPGEPLNPPARRGTASRCRRRTARASRTTTRRSSRSAWRRR
jgi:post-segregation antitoxin (ccd killing protein)